MWGSSPNDIWGISSGLSDSTIFHYDGVKWTCDGIFRLLSPNSIFGFARDNVWIGDIQGFIWHYDGISWSNFTTLNYLPDKKNCWEGIWGESPNDIYAVGAYLDENNQFNNGVIAHFDGTKWEILSINKKNTNSTRIYRSSIDRKFYLNGTHFNNQYGDSSYILQFDGKNIKTLYSGTYGVSQFGTVALVGNEILYILGRRIASFDGVNFNDVININESNYDNDISGRSKFDLFLFMIDGIAHFNGSDVQYLYKINSNVRLASSIIFDKQVIFSAIDFNTGNTLIIKGELKTK
jgi:hypothetical protein